MGKRRNLQCQLCGKFFLAYQTRYGLLRANPTLTSWTYSELELVFCPYCYTGLVRPIIDLVKKIYQEIKLAK